MKSCGLSASRLIEGRVTLIIGAKFEKYRAIYHAAENIKNHEQPSGGAADCYDDESKE